MASASRLTRDYVCPGGLEIDAIRQPNGEWHVGPWLGLRLGTIIRHGARRWEAQPTNGGQPVTRVALWMAVYALCPKVEA